MSTGLWYAWTGIGLSGIGLLGFVMHRHILYRLLAFNIIGSGAFLILVGLAHDNHRFDPVTQALVLTGIVVAIASTALVLVLLKRWSRDSNRPDLPEDWPQ